MQPADVLCDDPDPVRRRAGGDARIVAVEVAQHAGAQLALADVDALACLRTRKQPVAADLAVVDVVYDLPRKRHRHLRREACHRVPVIARKRPIRPEPARASLRAFPFTIAAGA